MEERKGTKKAPRAQQSASVGIIGLIDGLRVWVANHTDGRFPLQALHLYRDAEQRRAEEGAAPLPISGRIEVGGVIRGQAAWEVRRLGDWEHHASQLLHLLNDVLAWLNQQGNSPTKQDTPGEQRRPDLNKAEQAVWQVLGNGPMDGQEIADKAGYSYDYVRAVLADLVRRDVLLKCKAGYCRPE
jgi:hypothetical protein